MKIETIAGGYIDNFSIYPFGDNPTKPVKTKVLAFDKDAHKHLELCNKVFVEAMREVPPGFYTLVDESGYVLDFRIGKRHGVRVRPYDGKTINRTKQRPCLRVIVEKSR